MFLLTVVEAGCESLMQPGLRCLGNKFHLVSINCTCTMVMNNLLVACYWILMCCTLARLPLIYYIWKEIAHEALISSLYDINHYSKERLALTCWWNSSYSIAPKGLTVELWSKFSHTRIKADFGCSVAEAVAGGLGRSEAVRVTPYILLASHRSAFCNCTRYREDLLAGARGFSLPPWEGFPR